MNFKLVQFSVALLFLLLASTCEARLTQLPDDVIVTTAGATVKIACFTENKNYPPAWSHIRIGSTQQNDVYLTVKLAGQATIAGRMTEEYYGRFNVQEDRTTGEYSLLVTNVQPGDAGRYTCTARGGLGQQASAELGVIESDPQCESNATDAIGENICNHEPDYVELSCGFRFKGNVLPMVNWRKSDRPGLVVPPDRAQFTDDSGVALSKFVVKADAEDLSGSSFTCIPVVHPSSDVEESRISCTTPVINVLKITNLTESRKVVEAEEVQCTPPPHLLQTGCKWVKRRLEDGVGPTETVVSNGRLLNLYRPEFHSGIYVCIVECNIRGQPCPVEALTITYEPTAPLQGESISTSRPTLVIIVVVVSTVVFTIIATLVGVAIYLKFSSKTSLSKPEEPSHLHTFSNAVSGISSEREIVFRTESVPLRESGDAAIDITDSTWLLAKPGDRERRNRRVEENALARMRSNPPRLSTESSTEDQDVAEGVRRRLPETSKDE